MNKELLRDAITVSLMRSAGLDKHKARECADVVAAVLAAIGAPDQEPVDGVVVRDTQPTLLRECDIKSTDLRLYTKPQPVAYLQIRLDLMTAERDKLHRENGDMRQSLHFFKPVADLTDVHLLSLAYDCNAMPECVTDKTLMAFARAVLAAQKGKS